MSVKRYSNELRHSSFHPLTENQAGQYVLHSDYAALLARHTALVDAVKRLTKADDDLLTLWDAMANNKPLEDEYHAARAEVDRLIGEEVNG